MVIPGLLLFTRETPAADTLLPCTKIRLKAIDAQSCDKPESLIFVCIKLRCRRLFKMTKPATESSSKSVSRAENRSSTGIAVRQHVHADVIFGHESKISARRRTFLDKCLMCSSSKEVEPRSSFVRLSLGCNTLSHSS